MHYHISRNGQTYGPYTLEDLKRYLASGNVLPTDMAKADGPDEPGGPAQPWVAVSELLGTAATPPPAAAFTGQSYANPGAPATVYIDPAYTGPGFAGSAPAGVNPAFAASQYPDAPNLNWGLYLLFAILTCGIFSKVFTVIQAVWLKKVQPNSNGVIFYVALYVLAVFNLIHGFSVWGAMMAHPGVFPYMGGGINSVLKIVYFVLLIVTRFVMSASLEEHFNGAEPVGLRLNPVMVFFFGGVYFQYHLNRINALKQAARYGVGRTF